MIVSFHFLCWVLLFQSFEPFYFTFLPLQNSLGSTKDSEMEDGLDWEAQGAFEREQYLQRTSDFEE